MAFPGGFPNGLGVTLRATGIRSSLWPGRKRTPMGASHVPGGHGQGLGTASAGGCPNTWAGEAGSTAHKEGGREEPHRPGTPGACSRPQWPPKLAPQIAALGHRFLPLLPGPGGSHRFSGPACHTGPCPRERPCWVPRLSKDLGVTLGLH